MYVSAVIMSALPQATAANPHTNLPNVYIEIANKMGFQQKEITRPFKFLAYCGSLS
jgi:hypothetical protein